MGIIRNTTEGIYPFQQAPYNKIAQGGFKSGQLSLYSSGRQTGKSMLNAMYGKLYSDNLCQEIIMNAQKYLQELKLEFADLATDRIDQRKKVKQYKFSRAKWYVADFDWKHQDEVHEWCYHQFGPHPQNPDAWSRWCHKYQGKIHFRDSKDYEWFMLRWT